LVVRSLIVSISVIYCLEITHLIFEMIGYVSSKTLNTYNNNNNGLFVLAVTLIYSSSCSPRRSAARSFLYITLYVRLSDLLHEET